MPALGSPIQLRLPGQRYGADPQRQRVATMAIMATKLAEEVGCRGGGRMGPGVLDIEPDLLFQAQ